MTPSDALDLSVVVSTRNDLHGGDPLKRLQAFINCFDTQCGRAGLRAEVIVVEWNPPADRPRVSQLLRWPVRRHCAYRFIEVPALLHHTLRHSNELPLFQMIAKNVGIRRARGRFVLSTNIDIIFSDALIDRIASGQLTPGRLYRTNRRDIEDGFPVDAPLCEQMEYCRTHQLRWHRRGATHPLEPTGQLRRLTADIIRSESISFGDGWHSREGTPESRFFRWAGSRAELFIADVRSGEVLELEIETHRARDDEWVEIAIIDDGGLELRRVVIRGHHTIQVAGVKPGRVFLVVVTAQERSDDDLSLFECRADLRYRVFDIRLCRPQEPAVARQPAQRTRPALVNEPGVTIPLKDLQFAWNKVNASDGIDESRTLTTDSLSESYALEWRGTAPATDRYQFQLNYVAHQGDVAVGILSSTRQRWLAYSHRPQGWEAERTLTVDVELSAGQRFWVLIANNHPERDRASEVTLRRLIVRGHDAERLVARSKLARADRWMGRLLSRVSARVAPLLPMPVRDEIIDRSDRVSALDAQVLRLEQLVQELERTCSELSATASAHQSRAYAFSRLGDLASHAAFLNRHRPPALHLNSCGDFQLMAREHWFELKGFPEINAYSMNVDGLFGYVAHYAGIREHVLEEPCCIYHIEHEKGSGWTPEGEAVLRRRMDDSGIPWVDATIVTTWASYMDWLGAPLLFNLREWGFGDLVLPEVSIVEEVQR